MRQNGCFRPVNFNLTRMRQRCWATAPSAARWRHCNNTITPDGSEHPAAASSCSSPPLLSMRGGGGEWGGRSSSKQAELEPGARSGQRSCGGISAMAAGGGGAGGLCWRTCCLLFVFWAVSVCGEDRTLMVEVGECGVHAPARKNSAPGSRSHHF